MLLNTLRMRDYVDDLSGVIEHITTKSGAVPYVVLFPAGHP